MHVLVVNNIYPPIMAGGAELMVAWLSEGLAARGYRVEVAADGPIPSRAPSDSSHPRFTR